MTLRELTNDYALWRRNRSLDTPTPSLLLSVRDLQEGRQEVP